MPSASILDELSRPLPEPPPKEVGVKRHTIAFRVTDEQMVAAEAFRSAFPTGTFSEAFQWLLSSAAGRELIAKRVRGEV